MEDVTDAAFRHMIAEIGRPSVMFTEFTSADGLIFADERGQKILRKKLSFSEIEQPIVAQLFSAFPERMEQAARIVAELGFDGLDINMGCPDRSIEKSRCGADLIKNPDRARALIRAAKAGAPNLPISVKTRIGYAKNELDTWLPELLAENPAVVTIHARTRNELSDVPAKWECIKQAVAIRHALGSKTLIVGNGDVKNIEDARAKASETGCDGIMLGRAIYGNPWLYNERFTKSLISPREKIEALAKHIKLFDELMSGTSNFAVMKKHFKAYISGWDGAKELRVRLMETATTEEALSILRASDLL